MSCLQCNVRKCKCCASAGWRESFLCFLYFQGRLPLVALRLPVPAVPAGLAGRGLLSCRMSVKHFGRSSLLLPFTLLTVPPDCEALEVVALCSEALRFALPPHPRAATPASVQTTPAHVNRAGDNTGKEVTMNF